MCIMEKEHSASEESEDSEFDDDTETDNDTDSESDSDDEDQAPDVSKDLTGDSGCFSEDIESKQTSKSATEKCPICLLEITDQMLGTPESCDHVFCLTCIHEWSKVTNTCPIDRLVFRLIFVTHEIGGLVIRKIEIPEHALMPDDEAEPEDTTVCEYCGLGDREDVLLLCDGCDLGFHTDCLENPLAEIPVGRWFCPTCATVRPAQTSRTPSRRSASHIPRTLANEMVISRIADTISAGVGAVRRRPRKRRTVRKRVSTSRRRSAKSSRRRTKKGRKTKRRKRSLKSRKGRKTRSCRVKKDALTTSSSKLRIANRLGICKPPPGRYLPVIKNRACGAASFGRFLPVTESLSVAGDGVIPALPDGPDLSPASRKTTYLASRRLLPLRTSAATVDGGSGDVLASILVGQDELLLPSHRVRVSVSGELEVINPSCASFVARSAAGVDGETRSGSTNHTNLNGSNKGYSQPSSGGTMTTALVDSTHSFSSQNSTNISNCPGDIPMPDSTTILPGLDTGIRKPTNDRNAKSAVGLTQRPRPITEKAAADSTTSDDRLVDNRSRSESDYSDESDAADDSSSRSSSSSRTSEGNQSPPPPPPPRPRQKRERSLSGSPFAPRKRGKPGDSPVSKSPTRIIRPGFDHRRPRDRSSSPEERWRRRRSISRSPKRRHPRERRISPQPRRPPPPPRLDYRRPPRGRSPPRRPVLRRSPIHANRNLPRRRSPPRRVVRPPQRKPSPINIFNISLDSSDLRLSLTRKEPTKRRKAQVRKDSTVIPAAETGLIQTGRPYVTVQVTGRKPELPNKKRKVVMSPSRLVSSNIAKMVDISIASRNVAQEHTVFDSNREKSLTPEHRSVSQQRSVSRSRSRSSESFSSVASSKTSDSYKHKKRRKHTSKRRHKKKLKEIRKLKKLKKKQRKLQQEIQRVQVDQPSSANSEDSESSDKPDTSANQAIEKDSDITKENAETVKSPSLSPADLNISEDKDDEMLMQALALSPLLSGAHCDDETESHRPKIKRPPATTCDSSIRDFESNEYATNHKAPSPIRYDSSPNKDSPLSKLRSSKSPIAASDKRTVIHESKEPAKQEPKPTSISPTNMDDGASSRSSSPCIEQSTERAQSGPQPEPVHEEEEMKAPEEMEMYSPTFSPVASNNSEDSDHTSDKIDSTSNKDRCIDFDDNMSDDDDSDYDPAKLSPPPPPPPPPKRAPPTKPNKVTKVESPPMKRPEVDVLETEKVEETSEIPEAPVVSPLDSSSPAESDSDSVEVRLEQTKQFSVQNEAKLALAVDTAQKEERQWTEVEHKKSPDVAVTKTTVEEEEEEEEDSADDDEPYEPNEIIEEVPIVVRKSKASTMAAGSRKTNVELPPVLGRVLARTHKSPNRPTLPDIHLPSGSGKGRDLPPPPPPPKKGVLELPMPVISEQKQKASRLTDLPMPPAPPASLLTGKTENDSALDILKQLQGLSAGTSQSASRTTRPTGTVQSLAIEAVKNAIRPHYNRRLIDKPEYKYIVKRCVTKICRKCRTPDEVDPEKAVRLVTGYVDMVKTMRMKGKMLF